MHSLKNELLFWIKKHGQHEVEIPRWSQVMLCNIDYNWPKKCRMLEIKQENATASLAALRILIIGDDGREAL